MRENTLQHGLKNLFSDVETWMSVRNAMKRSGYRRRHVATDKLNTNQPLGLGQILQVASFRLIISTVGHVPQDRVRHMVSRPAFLARLGLPYIHDE